MAEPVQYALANGVPLVVGGTTEDKPEVAARVRWAGVGIDLRSSRPKPQSIRAAVRALLQTSSYRRRAAELQAEIAGQRPLDTIAETLSRAAHAAISR